jgi:eukaryotic-like serine/threonine-protein kinase
MSRLPSNTRAATMVPPESLKPRMPHTALLTPVIGVRVYSGSREMADKWSSGASEPAVLPPKLGGKYRPIRHIATGGMGTVYEVEHEMTGERLALKIIRGAHPALDPTVLQRFRREARVHAVLKDEHVVRVIDADLAPELGGVPFLVMDLLAGEDLADLVGDEPQPPSRVVGWLDEIAAPLDAAHAAGIVHRDLKPENLFLTRRADDSAIVKILDFGIAKIRGSADGSKTGTGAVLGTPLYMAPEQATAEHDRIGPGTDRWSIGMIAFRLLTGQPYWSTTNVSLLLADLVGKPLKPPSARAPKLSPAFDAWFLRSCDRDPTKRFASVCEQVAELARALGVGLPSQARRSDPRLGLTLSDWSSSSGRRSGRESAPVQSISGSVASAAPARSRPSSSRMAGALVLVAISVVIGVLLTKRSSTPAGAPQAATASTPASTAPIHAHPAAPAPLASPSAAAPTVQAAPGGSSEKKQPEKKRAPRPAQQPLKSTIPIEPAPVAAPDPLADPK